MGGALTEGEGGQRRKKVMVDGSERPGGAARGCEGEA